MMMTIKTLCLALAIAMTAAFNTNIAYSKEKYPKEDRKIWGSIELKYSLLDDLAIDFGQEVRFYKNREIMEQHLTDFGATYKFTKWFRLGLFYRYKTYPDETRAKKDKYANEVYTNFSFRQKFSGFEFNNRIRLHARFKNKEDDSYFVRNKLSAEYKQLLTWVSPFVAAEVFHRVGAGSNNNINKARYTVGLNFIPLDKHEISLYFLREDEFNKNKIVNSNIIGIDYQFKLN